MDAQKLDGKIVSDLCVLYVVMANKSDKKKSLSILINLIVNYAEHFLVIRFFIDHL